MLQYTFNFHDPLVLLRLSALLAIALIIIGLGIVEFRRPLGWRLKLLLGVVFAIGCLVIGYTLIRLRGA
jgi:hypothetical protein